MTTETKLQADIRDASPSDSFANAPFEEEGTLQWTKHCSNPKCCAVAYPTQERQGLLWVWPEAGSQAQIESQLRTPRIIPELEDNSDKVVKLSWSLRDLPYGWDFFMENVADPAHVPVSHHGIIGNRYKDDTVFTPNPQDKMVITFRQLLE